MARSLEKMSTMSVRRLISALSRQRVGAVKRHTKRLGARDVQANISTMLQVNPATTQNSAMPIKVKRSIGPNPLRMLPAPEPTMFARYNHAVRMPVRASAPYNGGAVNDQPERSSSDRDRQPRYDASWRRNDNINKAALHGA